MYKDALYVSDHLLTSIADDDLTVVSARCVNRLIVHPLHKIARELNDIPQRELIRTSAGVARVLHQDDESGMWCAAIAHNQQLMQRQREEQTDNAMRFPVFRAAQ